MVCIDSIHPLYGWCHIWLITPAGKCTDNVGAFKLDDERMEMYTTTLGELGDSMTGIFDEDSKEVTMYQYLFLRQEDGKSFAAKRAAKSCKSARI